MKFPDKIKKIIKDAGYNYKVRVFPRKEFIRKDGKKVIQEYDKVIVYAGRSIEKLAQKRSRKLVAWKNEKGEWEGNLEIAKEQGETGRFIYIIDYNDNKTELIKYEMFSDLDWNNNEKYAKNKLLKVLENWKFVERERAKLDEKDEK